MTALRALLASLLLVFCAGNAAALACSATVSDVAFGTVTPREGVRDATTGTLRVECRGAAPGVPVGACVALGAGSGGAAGGLSPRPMRRADGASLAYELRAGGGGPAFGTWTQAYLPVPIGLDGRGAAAVAVHADITASGTATPTGTYRSIFAGGSDASLTYGVALCGAGGAAAAIPAFRVTASVASSCAADGAALDFGRIGSAVAGPVDAAATLNVRCTEGTAYRVRLGPGGAAAGREARMMAGPGGGLAYGLHQDASRAAPWGDAPGQDVAAVGNGANQGFRVDGRIHGGQSAPVGLHADSVTVTIEC